MLNSVSINVAKNLAEILDSSGLKLTPKQSTLLSELTLPLQSDTAAIISSMPINPEASKPNYDYIVDMVNDLSTGKYNTNVGVTTYVQSNHDIVIDNYTLDLTRILSEHVAFARNVVNKEVNKLKECLSNRLSTYKYNDAEDFFNVAYYSLPDVFKSHIVEFEISGYITPSAKYSYEHMNIPDIPDMLAYILTGDDDQDTLIKNWFSAIGYDKALGYLMSDANENSMGVTSLLDYSFINYLFFRNLSLRDDLNVGLSLMQTRTIASGNRDYFANKIATSLELYKRMIRTKTILTSDSDMMFSYFNTKPLKLIIYSDVFNQLGESGCTIETLFGYISTTSDVSVTADVLVANKDKYNSAWNNTKSLYLIAVNNSRLDVFKQLLSAANEECLNSTGSEDELNYAKTNSNYTLVTNELVNAYIKDLLISDIDDIDRITLDIVAKIRFRFSTAYFLLNEMSEILKLSDKVTPLEAALYASVKYITDFLLEQVDVSK